MNTRERSYKDMNGIEEENHINLRMKINKNVNKRGQEVIKI